MPTEKLKYIDDDAKKGIKIDWKKVKKKYKELKCPEDVYNPSLVPFNDAKYFVCYSMRSVGKSTGWLLIGAILHWMYGITTVYVRQMESMILPKASKNMFSVVDQYGYIDKITGGEYNGVCYKSRRWYFCRYDEAGEIESRSPDAFCFMCCINKATELKSAANFPYGDLIIFDEFVNIAYMPDEFVYFCDLVKTIIRDRQSPIVVMLSNNTDKESPYFYEMEIYNEVRDMQPGDTITKTTERGTRIYVQYEKPSEKKQGALAVLNGLFFGFGNKRLGSITGEGWSIKPRQHIPQGAVWFVVQNLYIYHNGRHVKLDIVEHEELGLCCFVHWASKTYPDSVILTTEDRTDPRYQYGIGTGRLAIMLRQMIAENRIYYASDDLASFVGSYYNSIPEVL